MLTQRPDELFAADAEAAYAAGVSEDEIFDATASVAVGEGLRRLDAALRVIG